MLLLLLLTITTLEFLLMYITYNKKLLFGMEASWRKE